ncbi:MAG TPA: cysteine desulfurase [Myxococcota bacterium]|nr:cysteine desulfurase [Myxococcota bacterium]
MSGPLDVEAIRRDFPGLHQRVHGRPLVYLDSAATSHSPQVVVDALVRATTMDRANVHRGVHELSQRASAAYEEARAEVASFLGAADPREVVFTRGTTEAVNLVAAAWGERNVGPGDEIVVTAMEHHSNLVPWQVLAQRRGARLVVIPHDDRGALDLDAARRQIGPRARLVAATHVSNSLGTINDVRALADMAHAVGAVMLVDAAQSAPHLPIDVGALGCDLLAFSGHKVCGPFGVGALWGRLALLDATPPYQTGGGMIRRVALESSEFGDVPMRFEAGTPDVAGAVGLAAALRYVRAIGLDRIAAWEHTLLERATARLAEIPGVRVIGTAPEKAAVLSFVADRGHPSDLGTLLDQLGIAVRTGHHCTQPVMDHFGVPATARASFAFYNTLDEVDALADGITKVLSWM